ncbi:arginase family protein [Flavobacterium sp. GT3R68]|uniref:arginase family protein n=1 Tax=Flavobacterium sp. GT3R68 TaxID=2594437 RepID=UPI000F889915|nr:arginase family protein [Flavobacterium sp. GT3R68]RTY89356.1 arginase family protein [Flavobacterium sp. GSN2]TRW93916.1 arginase family protein [Flavobacterium sp. GT3R68]
MESKIQTNPYIVFDSSTEDKLSNTLTGEKILCGEKIIELIKFLREPKEFEIIEEKFCEIKDELPQLIHTLLAKKFLFRHSESEDTVTTITPCTPHLFNLPFLSKQKLQTLTEKAIVFIGVPLGMGNKTNTSASYYPNSLRNYTEKYSVKLNKESFFNSKAIGSANEFLSLEKLKRDGRLFDNGNIFFDSNESSTFCYHKIEKISKTIFEDTADKIPFFIGGDHSISYPIIKSALEVFGDDLCVIHFDAHTDTYDSPYSKIKHDQKTHHHGNFLTKCFEAGLKQAYQFGIRGLVNCNQEKNEFQTIYWCNEVKQLIKEKHGFDELPKDKKYYVTFDFDVLDPQFFKGTTTPVMNGFTLEECSYLIKTVLKDKDIIGLDVVELYTDKDELELTHQVASQFIFNLLNAIS